jgi:hypothetical protein
MAERLKTDAEKILIFKAEILLVARHSIKSGNLSRELGLSFAEYWLPNDAVSAENFYNTHYGPTLMIGFNTFRWFISASRRLPYEIKSMDDVYPGFKQICFAGELIEEGERAAPQESHDATPVVTVFAGLGKARVALERTFDGVGNWDADTRQGVREQIAKFEEWLDGVKAKLGE